MSLSQTLLELSRRHMAELPSHERADFADELDRLRMMRVAEDGLGVGDPLPDFALEDGAGRVWTSSELLDRGPLVLALFRGGWCPYCDITMLALEDARPAIETLGATAVGVMPGGRSEVAAAAAKRGVRFPLLADPANGFDALADVGDAVVPVVDLRRQVASAHGAAAAQPPCVLTMLEGSLAGILVDQVLRIEDVPVDRLESIEGVPLLPVAQVARVDSRLVSVLTVERLLPPL